jgi:hypothetical protein
MPAIIGIVDEGGNINLIDTRAKDDEAGRRFPEMSAQRRGKRS